MRFSRVLHPTIARVNAQLLTLPNPLWKRFAADETQQAISAPGATERYEIMANGRSVALDEGANTYIR